jgi:1-acyl-sn-glycerol-3-phosphate acyltransferase
VEKIRKGARELPHGVAIFPEGHRSRDGEVRPFRAAGLETILSERRMPVYLVLNEGVWRVRRVADLLFRVHLIDASSEVMGPFEAPVDDAALREFIGGLRQTLVDRLAEIRGAPAPRTP